MNKTELEKAKEVYAETCVVFLVKCMGVEMAEQELRSAQREKSQAGQEMVVAAKALKTLLRK